ncbi:uncharacterized protein LOC130387051 isoform X3 [Gadus chalcogrammus]|uniref:uncharacterized protein LOC130387051 isoform X3 n=1 Tax=Gadus chalcogrammus TaxID=1042646 RepID=UPI0024C4C96B|nr:uncharacterized protein LOC130387051 isoform X3 [Gadus chalcogrammus]
MPFTASRPSLSSAPRHAPVSASNLTTVESHQHRTSQTSSPRTLTATAQGPSSGVIHVGGAPTLRAEVIWILKSISDHHSYSSNEGISEIFKAMFSDSEIAATFTSGKNKTSYITKFGLAPFITKELVKEVNEASGGFVVMFDESLNKTTKTKPLDIHLRYWSGDHVALRYLGSQFMGHGKAVDLLKHFKECITDLDQRIMVSISMDGPNVNWKFLELLQRELGEQYAGKQLAVVGTCGLHTLHNSVKAGFNAWQMEKILRALHTIFLNVPARREDFIAVTKSSTFALPFCGHQWVENLPVAERALQIWPNILKYVAAVRTKDVNNPATSSFDTIEVAAKDPFVIAKLEFFTAVCRTVSPFLTRYQTDEPVLPFIAHDLAELLKSLLRRFVKIDLLRDATPAQLVRLDVTEKEATVPVRAIDIGIGAENAIKLT